MNEKNLFFCWALFLLCCYGIGALWQQHDALGLQHDIAAVKHKIDLLDQDLKELEQEIASYKTVAHLTAALIPQEFVPASCYTVMTYT
jgi:cell division protein FtsL